MQSKKELSIKIIARTKDQAINDVIREYMEILSGKAAGVCYMPENYFEICDEFSKDTNLKRYHATQKSGHNSVQEHGHITFEIQNIPKIVAMVLNSIGVYSTSEKSARYTKMNPENEIELELYNKWTEIFKKLVAGYYPDKTEKEVEKLAIENARYMISVFTPTSMIYTISYGECKMIITMINELIYNYTSDKSKFIGYNSDYIIKFFSRLINELTTFKNELIDAIDGYDDEYKNPKGNKFRFLMNTYIDEPDDIPLTNISDSYTLNYECSFACLAQLERHRTIKYGMYFEKDDKYYIPDVLKNSNLEKEWIVDMMKVKYPQGQMITVIEQATIEDFVLKCKERLCSRAQYEISKQTENLLLKFADLGEKNLCNYNLKLINSLCNYVETKTFPYKALAPRCAIKGYKCNEPCSRGCYGLIRKV